MTDPLVSVCMPCFNAGGYVLDAINSILQQTWTSLELIVVNDGSVDDSASILDSLSDSRIKVIHQENRGQCAAANRAFAESQGTLIKFFDADDLLAPDSIRSQVGRLGSRQDALASSRWGRFYYDDISTFQLNPEPVWCDMSSLDWLVEAWFNARPMMQCGLWLIPRSLLDQTGGWDESLSLINDFEFFARILSHAQDVLFTPQATLYYRSGLEGSLSGQKNRKAAESALHSLIRGTECLLKHRSDSKTLLSCANMLQDFTYTFYPEHPDLIRSAQSRVAELGGSSLQPDGPPRFHQLRHFIGWRASRRVQRFFSR